MTDGAPASLLRLARSVRLLPQNPPRHAVGLAVVTAAVLGAATGVVLALAAPTPESGGAPPAAMITASFPGRPPETVNPSVPAIRPPEARTTSTSADPTAEVAPAMPAAAASSPAAAPSPPFAMRIPAAPSPAPRATATRPPAGRNPMVQAGAAASPVSRRGDGPGAAPPLAAAGVSAMGLSPLDAPARPGEGTGDDSSAADELIWLTERAFQSGHPAEAVRLGKKALAAHGGARAHLALAAAYFDLRRFDDAQASYEAVLQTEPGNQAARIGLDLAKTAQARTPEPEQP